MINERRHKDFLSHFSERLDDYVSIFSPKLAMHRKAYRFSYDILDRYRTRTKRSTHGGTGDQHLTESSHDKQREICRDLSRNNPLVKGLFSRLATGIVGTSTTIQARTEDEGWNNAAEQLWQEEMIDRPCDITGRFNIHAFLKKMYRTYCCDGDMLVLFLDDTIQAIEGEQCGTPYGIKYKPQNFDVVNGVAISKQTKKVIGYYIGSPNKWGYIKADSFQQYSADKIHHVFNSDRFSYSRGEPALISAVDAIDKLFGYIDAELVAAKINACFPVTVITKDATGMRLPYAGGISTTGKDEDETPLEKIVPGMIWHGEPGESLSALGQARPPSAFDPFILRILTLIGQPLSLPLMLVTQDFSGATFMNSRIAYQEARDTWRDEQEIVIKPFVRRLWTLKVQEWIKRNDLTDREDYSKHEIFCKRWPYVDPYKEANADKVQLENGTITRTTICARQGEDFKDVIEQRAREEELIKEKGVILTKNEKKHVNAE